MKRFILVYIVGAMAIASAQGSDTQGPSILSRGMGTFVQGGGELLRLRPYFSLTGVYDTGLAAATVDESGKVPSVEDYGGRAEFGVTGYHSWRRTLLGLDYRGNVQHYRRQSYYDSTNHALILGITRQVNRNLTFAVREAAGTQSRDYGSFNGYTLFDSRSANVPTNELFNGRTDYNTTMGDLTYSASRRLSFNIGGSGMMVRRRSTALVGMNGASARGDVQYQLGPRVSVGGDYGYSRYTFTQSFGTTDIHMASFDLSFGIGRNWDFSLRAGGARAETLGLQRVSVDPVIAAITGQGTDNVVMYRLNYLPVFSARMSRAFRRSTISFQGSSGTSAGNGVYLTSRTTGGGVSLSHTASRRWNFGLSADYSQYSSLMNSIGKYRGYTGSAGVTFQVNEAFHLVAHYYARQFEVQQSAFGRRLSHNISLGFAFSPGDLPLSLW